MMYMMRMLLEMMMEVPPDCAGEDGHRPKWAAQRCTVPVLLIIIGITGYQDEHVNDRDLKGGKMNIMIVKEE